MSTPSYQGSQRGGFKRPSSGGSGRRDRFAGGFTNSQRSGAGSFSPRSSQGGFRRGGNSGSFGGNRRSATPKRKGFGTYIDPTRFVNKAVSIEEVAYVPTHRFADFDILPQLKEAIANRGYELPTPIQDESIPQLLKGKDIVGIADTGTGKTGAFLVPLINKILTKQGDHVLIVVPTRELAIQIETEFRALTRNLRMDAVCIVGGASIAPQLKGLSRRPQFIIGTPGRLKDVIERGSLGLYNFNSIVLDEADRMLDMGFIADMRYLIGLMPPEHQTLFFSATLSPEIKRLIGEFLKDPVSITLKSRDTSKNVEQDVVHIPRGTDKLDVLQMILAKPEVTKALVFGRTKHGVEKLATTLTKSGFKAEAIHGNKTHNNRQRALTRFRDSEAQVLVATDVAARGLDIPGVTHVINFDLPGTHEDYVHRIGRTGRAGARGIALTFIEG